MPRVDRGIVGDGWVSHVVPRFRYKAGPFPFFLLTSLPCSHFTFFFVSSRSSNMVKSEHLDVAPEETAAVPPAKRPRGRPPKKGGRGRGKAVASAAAGSSTGRGKGGDRAGSKKAGAAGGGVGGGIGRGQSLLLIRDSSSEKEATPVLPPPGFDPIPKHAPAATEDEEDSTELSSASSDSLENPWRLGWDVFPIEEFLLILHSPVTGPVQRLPDAFADALPGVGHFMFKLFREGAIQGPWNATVRFTSQVEGDDVVNKVEFVRGWDEFADFYEPLLPSSA